MSVFTVPRLRRGIGATLTVLLLGSVPPAHAHPGDACFEAIHNGMPGAARQCQTGAEAGDALSQYNLAMLLLDPAAGHADQAAARQWLRRAADSLPIAGYALATLLLENGEQAEGERFLEAAARAGVVDAQFDYATLLLERAQDSEAGDAALAARAAQWYERAARNGDIGARFNLAMLLLASEPPVHDPAAGLAWLYTLGELPDHNRVASLTRRYEAQLDDDTVARARALLPQLLAPPAAD